MQGLAGKSACRPLHFCDREAVVGGWSPPGFGVPLVPKNLKFSSVFLKNKIFAYITYTPAFCPPTV